MKRERKIAKPPVLQFVKQLENRSRFVLIAIAFLIIAVIGLVDYLTGHEISFSVFYPVEAPAQRAVQFALQPPVLFFRLRRNSAAGG